MVKRPQSDFMIELIEPALLLEVREVKEEIFEFTSVKFIAAQPAYNGSVTGAGNLLANQKMRQPRGGYDRLVIGDNHLLDEIEYVGRVGGHWRPSNPSRIDHAANIRGFVVIGVGIHRGIGRTDAIESIESTS